MKLDNQMLGLMQMFSRLTNADLEGCFQDELSKQMVFVVKEGDMSKAIGKGGANVHRLEAMMKCRVKLVEYSTNRAVFVERMLAPLKVRQVIEQEDNVLLIEPLDHKTRGYIIGRAASSLRNLEKNLRHFFEVKEIKVA